MMLFHGSNVVVEKPIILPNLRPMDFGRGFYLTQSEVQAGSWARTVTVRRRAGFPMLNRYSVDEERFSKLEQLRFDGPTGEWLDFIVANRKDAYVGPAYDVVMGPVANDSTLAVINDYMAGRFPRHIAIELLKPQNLSDQCVCLTQAALSCLTFEGVVRL